MRKLLAALVVLALAGIAAAQQGTTIKQSDTKPETMTTKAPDETDKKFMKFAHQGNLAEIQLGQLAQQNGQAQEIKQFGQQMVSDHSNADDQLKSLAQTQQVSLPIETDRQHQDTKAKLETLKGAAFDKAYMLAMLQDHQKTVQQFQKEANTAHDPEVKKLAAGTLPKLQEHLKLAQDTLNKVKSGAIQ